MEALNLIIKKRQMDNEEAKDSKEVAEWVLTIKAVASMGAAAASKTTVNAAVLAAVVALAAATQKAARTAAVCGACFPRSCQPGKYNGDWRQATWARALLSPTWERSPFLQLAQQPPGRRPRPVRSRGRVPGASGATVRKTHSAAVAPAKAAGSPGPSTEASLPRPRPRLLQAVLGYALGASGATARKTHSAAVGPATAAGRPGLLRRGLLRRRRRPKRLRSRALPARPPAQQLARRPCPF